MKKLFAKITCCLLVGLVFSFGGRKLRVQHSEFSTNKETKLPFSKQSETSVLSIVWDFLFSGISEEVIPTTLRIPARWNTKQCVVELLSFIYIMQKIHDVECCHNRSPFLFLTSDYYVFALRKIVI